MEKNIKFPLISVVMATYNGEKYVAMQIESILNQDYKNLEVVVVDDASTDNTREILGDFASNHKNVKLIFQHENSGLLRTFERGIAIAKGEYIALSDQDDIWLQSKITRLSNEIGDNLLIHSDATLIDENGHLVANSHFNFAKNRNKSDFFDYLQSNNVTGCTCMFKAELKKLILPFPGYFYAHDHYIAIVASFFGKIKLLDERLVLYRQHSNNAIGAKRPDFNMFFLECKKKADSYASLLATPAFMGNKHVELFCNYRRCIYERQLLSMSDMWLLLRQKHGMKYLLYFLSLTVLPRKLTRQMYRLYK